MKQGILKLLLLLTLLTGLPPNLLAQIAKRANNWYFGGNAGLTFNTNPPQFLTGSQIHGDEGCASISDNNGNLLFYTNGVDVWNRNNITMPNGFGLLGCESSTMSCIIIPKPGDNAKYYVFTSSCSELEYREGYNYSIVDMSLDNGLGDLSSKNNLLYKPGTEKLTATLHADGISYWFVAKDSGTNRFRSFLINCNGVNPSPVVSDVGRALDGNQILQGHGYMKISPDGKKIANIAYSTEMVLQVFDFDNSTGIISNPITISNFEPAPVIDFYLYGLEFSPDSKLIYVSGIFGNTTDIKKRIYQYNITSNNEAAANASKYTLFPTGSYFFNRALQLGPDGKIYSANEAITDLSFPLSVINLPNIPGAGCNYTESVIGTGPGVCYAGLPVFVSSIFNPSPSGLDFSTAFIDCYVQFSGSTSYPGNIKWHWDFGDGFSDTLQVAKHSYKRTGTYPVSLTIYRSAACGILDSFKITKPVVINNVFAVDFGYSGSCVNQPYRFSDSTKLTIGNITGHSWNFGDNSPITTGTNPVHSFTVPGKYNVKLIISTNGVCNADSITKELWVDTKPVADFKAPDGCINIPVSFTDFSNNTAGAVIDYRWNFGDSKTDSIKNPVHTYRSYGNFQVKLSVSSLHGCMADTIKTIVIESKPKASFDYEKPCVNEATVFTSLSQNDFGNITKWQWAFGDNTTSITENPAHTYSNAGSYPASLIVETQNGCVSDAENMPVIIQKANASAGRDTIGFSNQPLQLNASGGNNYVWEPAYGLNNPYIANPIAILEHDTTYRVTVTTTGGCIDEDEITIRVYSTANVFMPSAFTPDNRGGNNTFKPLGDGIAKIEYFRVYNRYGQVVFETNNLYGGWDGKYKGIEQSQGTYVYILKAVNILGRAVEKKGTVMLIR